VDYAYYLKGLVNFNEDLGLLGGIVQQDLSERDPNAARNAFAAFKELVTRFPGSQYAPDSRAHAISESTRWRVMKSMSPIIICARGAYVLPLTAPRVCSPITRKPGHA